MRYDTHFTLLSNGCTEENQRKRKHIQKHQEDSKQTTHKDESPLSPLEHTAMQHKTHAPTDIFTQISIQGIGNTSHLLMMFVTEISQTSTRVTPVTY